MEEQKQSTSSNYFKGLSRRDYIQKAHIVNNEMKAQLNRKSLKYNWHEADVTVLEGVFARGDRKVGKVIEEAYRLGCLYDSWSESFDNEKWMQALDWYILCTFCRWYNKKHHQRQRLKGLRNTRQRLEQKGLQRMTA